MELGSHAKPGEASGASSYASTARTFAGSAQARRENIPHGDLKVVEYDSKTVGAKRKLVAEIRSLYAEAETSSMELGGLSRSAELAAESLKLITLRYKNGESTVLEVVDAQTSYAQANTAYQDGAVRYRVALANLQTLTGVLTTP